MKIVNVIQRYPPAIGGSETWCQEFSRYLCGRGHKVKVLTLDVAGEDQFFANTPNTMAFGRLAFDGEVVVRRYKRSLPIYSVHQLIYRRLLDQCLNIYPYGPHSIEMYGRMWRELRAADVVLLHTLPYSHNYIAFFLSKLFCKKTIAVPHFHPGHPHFERPQHYWFLRHCDAVIAVTDFERRYLAEKGVPKEKIHVMGNGVRPEVFEPVNLQTFRSKLASCYGLRPEEKVITFIGRKIPEKGVAELIAAVRLIPRKTPLRLFLVGPAYDWYRELYGRLPQEDKKKIIDMEVLSHQEKVNLLHLTDLVVLPSRYEAFGIVFLEAWICGAPVIGSKEGAVPGVLGDDGLLSRYGDVNDLTSKIRYALDNQSKLKAMARRGREKVLHQYTWDAIGAAGERILLETGFRQRPRNDGQV